ncbi:MAG TPA: hypothetical protein VF628_13695 [Allosphingosinicella sp.]|jgi:hypothetical protein
MNWLFDSGHAADLVVAVLLVEAVWLIVRKGWDAGEVTALLLPAAMMMLALRGALTGADWPWIALPLAASFPLHLIDIGRRVLSARRPV